MSVSDEGDTGTGILDVFDRYNFTVNEAEPLEKEVAVDPEMLGKVFENLLPENIRHRQRHLLHAASHRPLHVPAGAVALSRARPPDIPQEELVVFLRLAERFADFEANGDKDTRRQAPPRSDQPNAARLDELLATDRSVRSRYRLRRFSRGHDARNRARPHGPGCFRWKRRCSTEADTTHRIALRTHLSGMPFSIPSTV